MQETFHSLKKLAPPDLLTIYTCFTSLNSLNNHNNPSFLINPYHIFTTNQHSAFAFMQHPVHFCKDIDSDRKPHGAPLAIVVCADKNTAWIRPFDKASMFVIDSSIAADHMMMCAQDLGLSSCWITYFDPTTVRKRFNIPNNLVPVNILAIGYGTDTPQSPDRHAQTRKPLNSMVQYSSFRSCLYGN